MATQGEVRRADRIAIEIVTPKGMALKTEADEVAAPSVNGEFGVLPGHLPLLAALQTGIVTYRVGTETKKCAVGPGFVEAGPDRVVLLTDRYATRDQVDPIIVRKELAEVQQKLVELQATTSDPGVDATKTRLDLEALSREEQWLATELELYGDPFIPTLRLTEGATPPQADAPAEPSEPQGAAHQLPT
jgi:F-type H+-transporting ATPase subunit epsilon